MKHEQSRIYLTSRELIADAAVVIGKLPPPSATSRAALGFNLNRLVTKLAERGGIRLATS